jgi:hypothetical protein
MQTFSYVGFHVLAVKTDHPAAQADAWYRTLRRGQVIHRAAADPKKFCCFIGRYHIALQNPL